MRTLIFLSLCCLFPLFTYGQEDNTTECPYFIVSSQDSAGVAFSLISTDVDATVSGVIANVVVEQTYFNAGDSTVDANYVFPMSTRAAIYAMEMELDGRTIKAEIRRRDEAQDIFNKADSSGLTATLLEQERPNVFQMSLANIGPGDSLKVRMTYTELLEPSFGVYQFVFPSIVGPRFTVGGEDWVYDAQRDAVPLAETELNIALKINGGMAVSAKNTSHDEPIDYVGNTATTSLITNPGPDFVVDYTLNGGEIQTGMLLYEGEEENFFLSMIQPAAPEVVAPDLKREYIFLMDVSGSMRGAPLETSKRLIVDLLRDLTPNDRFNIVFFAGGSNRLAPNSLPVTTDNINQAIALIENLQAGGGTRILPALQDALAMTIDKSYSRVFAILTDGFVTVEKETYELIRGNLHEANFFSFGIGTSVNRFIIEGIAYVGEGQPFVVSQGVDPNAVADAFREYIERPVLNNVEVSFSEIDVYDVEPLTIPDVFAERPVIVYGKYHGSARGSMHLSGDLANVTVTDSLNFADFTEGMEDNVALKYLWARKRIRLMEDYGIASNEADTVSIEEEITRLGLQYSLVTEYTSFVAVDSNAVSGVPEIEGGDSDGEVVEVDELGDLDGREESYFTVLGTVVGADRTLRLRFDRPLNGQEVQLRIVGLDGRTLASYALAPVGIDQEIIFQLDESLPGGLYYATLLDQSQVLDAEAVILR
ncbi:MAG: VIT domain-containing protein [Bacteroidota bacterium]